MGLKPTYKTEHSPSAHSVHQPISPSANPHCQTVKISLTRYVTKHRYARIRYVAHRYPPPLPTTYYLATHYLFQGFHVPRFMFPGSQVPRSPGPHVPRFPGSQVPMFPGSHVPRFPGSQVPKPSRFSPPTIGAMSMGQVHESL
jgi:hypothetical protein